MFSAKNYLNWIFSIALVVVMGCNGGGFGCGCAGMEPLPDQNGDGVPDWNYIPVDQQVEGGGQLRVSPNGFDTLTQIIPGVVNDALNSNPICIPGDSLVDVDIWGVTLASAGYCNVNQTGCTGGCRINLNVDSLDMSEQGGQLNVVLQFDAWADLVVNYYFILTGSDSCTINADLNNIVLDINLGLSIDGTTADGDPNDGELIPDLVDINRIDLSGVSISGCGGIGELVDAILGVVNSFFNSFLGDLIMPFMADILNGFVQDFLPSPLGMNHKFDLGSLFSGFSPGTRATMEFRGVPGGYVYMEGGGLSLGLITGFNADEDPSTRTPLLDSEPALCVPPMAAPDFTQVPLPKEVSRGTFKLLPAEEFRGMPDNSSDLTVGLSETTFDLIGHHVVTSGAMCLGIGTTLIPQLNLGTIGLLVPSLAELGTAEGDDPLLLVTRPQKPLDFKIGDGTEDSPSITIHIEDMEVDFYAFLYERYTRGFTISLTLDVGLNLEYVPDSNGDGMNDDPGLLPTIVGLQTENIELEVLNSEFLREDPNTLADVLPAIFDLALPLLSDGLQPFAIPCFSGFSLTNFSISKVSTSEDDFLAFAANLGATCPDSMMATIGEDYPSAGAILAQHDAKMAALNAPVTPVTTHATLAEVVTPKPEIIRRAILGAEDGELPRIVIDVPSHDEHGRALEHTWSMGDGYGLLHPYQAGAPLVIEDRAFAIQGRHTITVRSRVVGDWRTTGEGVTIPLVVDSVGPRIFGEQATVVDGNLVVPAHDLVSPDESIRFAFGSINDARPVTDWVTEISTDDLVAVANGGTIVKVWARDELGNESTGTVDAGPFIEFHGTSNGGGCDCDSTGGNGGGYLLAGLTLILLFGGRLRRRMFRALPYVALIVGVSALPACSCGGDPGGDLTCEVDEDCIDLCPEGTIPICFDNQCVCADDVPYGRIGSHSDMDLSTNGTAWVSAYNSSHGDLMVADYGNVGRIPNQEWEFVDGVPDGPIVLPQSDVRGGIFDPGPNVGQYTSIATRPDDTVAVSYFDVDNGSLMFASNTGGTWTKHVVDAGAVGGDPELGYEIAGMYTSITVRSDDGRPGIAYLAEVSEGASTRRTEVRYVAASTANPTSAADWSTWVVDSAALPPIDPENPDVLGLPGGVGLFIESARASDLSPVLVYYDRANGDLKLARFDSVSSVFAAPVVLDGTDVDVGWYPSIAVDVNDDVHVTYVSATSDDLMYINTIDNAPELVDDGYRIVGQTEDGLPKPEFHFVGDDSAVVLTTAGPVIAYQDATTHELLYAQRNGNGQWEHETVAGAETTFAGGFGFYATAKMDGDEVVMSTWVISQPTNDVWVEIFRRLVVIE